MTARSAYNGHRMRTLASRAWRLPGESPMSRRWSPVLLVIVFAASAASGVFAQVPDPNASAIWQKVHADLFAGA